MHALSLLFGALAPRGAALARGQASAHKVCAEARVARLIAARALARDASVFGRSTRVQAAAARARAARSARVVGARAVTARAVYATARVAGGASPRAARATGLADALVARLGHTGLIRRSSLTKERVFEALDELWRVALGVPCGVARELLERARIGERLDRLVAQRRALGCRRARERRVRDRRGCIPKRRVERRARVDERRARVDERRARVDERRALQAAVRMNPSAGLRRRHGRAPNREQRRDQERAA